MALPMLRGCYRLPSTFSFTRLFLNESVVLNRTGKTRLTASSSPTAVAEAVRPYSSDRGEHKQNVVVLGIPNPFIWFRSRLNCFLIRAFYDEEFSIEEFTEGATQAFSRVAVLLSQGQFAALDGLVAEDLIEKLEEKCNSMPSNYKKALSVDPREIMHTIPGDVGIFHAVDGRKFVRVLMRFWYLTSAQLPEDNIDGTYLFKVAIGEDGRETKRLLTAIYEFEREVTKGAPPDWIITRIEHSKLLD